VSTTARCGRRHAIPMIRPTARTRSSAVAARSISGRFGGDGRRDVIHRDRPRTGGEKRHQITVGIRRFTSDEERREWSWN
jgi:hypothetical protein